LRPRNAFPANPAKDKLEASLYPIAKRVKQNIRRNLTMAKTNITFETVRKIGLALPGVEAADGAAALKVHGKLLAWIPTNRSAEPDSIALRMDFDDRAELLAADPEVYYLPDHYAGYNAVLVRLSRVMPDVLPDLLGMAYKFVTRKASSRSATRKRVPRKRG
jgi:hypothetical protein